jgi:uncharacterized protein YkwD
MPEKHNCVGLSGATTLGPEFRGVSEHKIGDQANVDDDTTASTTGENQEWRDEPDYPSSPDVNPDGSIADVPSATATGGEDGGARLWGFVSALLGVLLTPLVFWRTTLKFGALIAVAIIVVSLMFGTGIAPIDSTVEDGVSAGEEFLDSSGSLAGAAGTATPTPESEPDESQDGEGTTWDNILGNSTDTHTTTDQSTTAPENRRRLEQETLEMLIHQRINGVRAEHSLSKLHFDADLQEIARYHSSDMVQNDYFAHTSPSGETMSDRYDRFNYDCRASTGSDTYATGGENIAYIPYQTSVSDDGETEYYATMGELADAFVEGWMESPGHRENILRSYWDDEGIGVTITERGGTTYVYATQNFC